MRIPAFSMLAACAISTATLAHEFPAGGEPRTVILETQREMAAARQQTLTGRVQLEEARPTPRGLSITLGLAFFENDAVLKPVAQLMIARLARYLEANPTVQVRLEGYAGDGVADSQATALQRSVLIGMDLARQGIASSRIYCTGQRGFPDEGGARAVEVIFSAPDGRFVDETSPL